jgi:hypothetical protein
MVATLQILLFGGAGACVMILAYAVVQRYPLLTITITLLSTLLSTPNLWFHPSFQVGNVNIYPMDVIAVLLAVNAIEGVRNRRNSSMSDVCMLILTVLIGIGVVSWIVEYDLKHGVNHWRYEIYFIVIYWWATSRSIDVKQLVHPFTLVAYIAVAVQIFIGVREGFGSAIVGHFDTAAGTWVDGRPINSESCLIILVALILNITARDGWNPVRLISCALFPVSLLISQQRSVWIACIVAATYLLAIDSRRRGWGRKALVPVAVALTLITPFLYWAFTENTALMDSATSTHTLDARIGFWTDRLSFDLTPLQWILGETFGPTPISVANGWEFQIQAHNMYVQFINQNGLLGLVLLLATLFLRLRESFRSISPAGSTLLIMMAVYGLFYVFPQYTALFLVGSATDEKQSRMRMIRSTSSSPRVAPGRIDTSVSSL